MYNKKCTAKNVLLKLYYLGVDGYGAQKPIKQVYELKNNMVCAQI